MKFSTISKISLIPFYRSFGNNEIFKLESKYNRDDVLQPYVFLKKYLQNRGIEFNTEDILKVKNSDVSLYLRIDIFKLILSYFHGKKSVYIQFEPPIIQPLHSKKNLKKIQGLFDVILTWNDELVDNKKFYKFYFPMPEPRQIANIPFDEKKFLTSISGYKMSKRKNELYSKRIEAIKYFEKNLPNDFDFFGVGWPAEEYISYKGKVDNKLEVLSKYKFSLCYENEEGMQGLISEKIFDCFYARTVPIFWGAENIEEYIPGECYIDKRKFDSYDSLQKYLIQMNEDEYYMRIKAIENYLESEAFKKFSSDNFAKTVYDTILISEKQKNFFRFIHSAGYASFCSIQNKSIFALKKMVKILKWK